jgi:uncharacterized membrane protein
VAAAHPADGRGAAAPDAAAAAARSTPWQRLLRALRHLCRTRAGTRRLFTAAVLVQIERACSAAEERHAGEIRFAVETALPLAALLHGMTPRQRALAVFAHLHMWDTEHNNGVLIYVLRADRAVEIVADRGINARVTIEEWQALCRTVEAQYRAGRFAEGSQTAIAGVAALLERHFPGRGDVVPTSNELPNQPILL